MGRTRIGASRELDRDIESNSGRRPLILGDEELDDVASAAHLALQGNRHLARAERLDDLLRAVHRLRGPLDRLQVVLVGRLDRRPDDFGASRDLRIVNDALAAIGPQLPVSTARPGRTRRRRWRR